MNIKITNFSAVILIFTWVAGVVIENPFWPRMGAIVFPPYSYYVLVDRLITTYAPDLISR
jgi:hypothetical protein